MSSVYITTVLHESITARVFNVPIYVQSNQKMHDLYATKNISKMVLRDAFWAVYSQIFS